MKRRHSATLLSRPGVCGVGVERDAFGEWVLTIHLDANAPAASDGLPSNLDGYPVRLLRSGPFVKQ